MTNEEMNRYCHEVILGKCWHEGVTDAVFEMGVGALDVPHWCPKCKSAVNPPNEDGLFNPNYCSDLNAIALVEATVIEKGGLYFNAIREVVDNDTPSKWVTATALQRATACVKAWEGKDAR